ncbi:aminoglycoside N(3)-acetyltransferase [Natrialba taiwanensis]|uniref:Aminoglycoside N3-acetyltransferase n=1 Tax=Natrialba taiwanensis DSM 12281 TaxID=1230458 RepID=L9ZGP9_9EURY|nr:AAC(3) family N-acetyltransferase [Natrialba taiwanensis]ELY85650.1 aminoglycoside N3-acetyltransferase [Natrialba taiwanensis DSM 12281]
MSEADAVDRVAEPATVSTLTEEFRALGVEAGEVVLVHSSLSSLGWVAGDAQAVVEALRNAVTPSGTLVMPTHTTQYSDPAVWSNPPVPDDWVDTIRSSRPPFRPAATPSRGMGAIPECFRTYDDVVRSSHPVYSFAAWGADAEAVVSEHGLDYGLGEDSPLATVAELGGTVLLLGVGHDSNTSLHLAEYRAALDQETTRNTVPVLEDGDRVQREYVDIDQSTDDFPEVGAAFEQQAGSAVTTGTVSVATARLVSQPELVDFAVDWFEANR